MLYYSYEQALSCTIEEQYYGNISQQPYMTVAEYFELCRNNPDAHYEYIDGHIAMLPNESLNHARIVTNLIGTLRDPHQGACQVFTLDAVVRLSPTRYVLPNISVTCDERDHIDKEYVQYPNVIFEVHSPNTEAYDRGNKFLYYRECPTLQEYVLVSSSFPLIEVFRREKNDLWVLTTFKLEGNVQLINLGIRFPVKDIYENIAFPAGEKTN